MRSLLRLALTPLLLALLTLVGCRHVASSNAEAALQSYPATDDRIQVMGRHLEGDEGAVQFGASGVTFFMQFDGTRLDAELEEELPEGTDHNWFTVVVDGGEPRRFRTEPGQRRYTLADSLEAGPHTVALSKATEGQNGVHRLVAVHTQELLEAGPLPERQIEYIGDSITAGYGLDPEPVGCGEGTWFDQTHAWLSYAPRLARRLDAQWMLSAVSGMGMHRNWNSPAPVMPDVYDGVYLSYADTTSTWDLDRYTPDLVVIGLGTNDFSDGDGPMPREALDGEAFVRAYTQFVERLRETHPEAQLLLLNSAMLDASKEQQLADYLQQVADNRREVSDDAIATFTFDGRYVDGCDAHPSLQEHVAMADELEPVVRELMGW